MDFSLNEKPPEESNKWLDFERQLHELLRTTSDIPDIVCSLDKILKERIALEFMALARLPIESSVEWLYSRYRGSSPLSLPKAKLDNGTYERLLESISARDLDKEEFLSFFNSSGQMPDFPDVHSLPIFPLMVGSECKGFLLLGSSSQKPLDVHAAWSLRLFCCNLGALMQLSETRTKLAGKSRQFEIILNHAEEGINIIDKNHNIRYANAWTQRKFGPQSSHHKCYQSFFGAEGPCSGCPIASQSNTGNSVQKASGRDFFSLFLHPVSGGGKADYFIEIIRDRTIRKRYEEVVVERNKLNSIVEFARSVGHELNQPLTGISGFCALIKEEVDADSPTFRDIVEIEKQALRLEKIVVKFQNIAHLDYSEDKENMEEQGNNG